MNRTTLALSVATAFAVGLALRPSPSHASPAGSPSAVLELSDAFRDVHRRVAPSVVGVAAFATVRGEDGDDRPRRRRIARGSGVLVRDDGTILTNHHVIEGAEEVVVTLGDERDLAARILGRDRETDLAVLDLAGQGFPCVPLAEGEPPEVGTWVAAIGHPFGLWRTMTAGIVSGRGRSGLAIATYEDFLQTDAAINAGNSGGPLVDLAGRVVGINTAKGTPHAESDGLGFAIPAYLARKVLDGILADGRVQRGWIGIRFEPLRPRRAQALGLSPEARVVVEEVLDGGPAARAGLAAGDVVLSIDGVEVRRDQELLRTVADLTPGTRIAIEVWRGGERLPLAVEVGERRIDADG